MVGEILRSYGWISLDSPTPTPVKMYQQTTQLTTLLSSSWRRSRTSQRDIQCNTAGHSRSFSCHLDCFTPITKEEVVKLLRELPDKTYNIDPVLSHVIKRQADTLAPFIALVFNKSMTNGVFPDAFKNTTITPLRKKIGLDINDLKNFRPVSNLSFLLKILKKVVHGRMVAHLEATDARPRTQSAYRRHHSTDRTSEDVQRHQHRHRLWTGHGFVPAGPVGSMWHCWPLYPARSIGENIWLYRLDNWMALHISWEPIFSGLFCEPIHHQCCSSAVSFRDPSWVLCCSLSTRLS